MRPQGRARAWAGAALALWLAGCVGAPDRPRPSEEAAPARAPRPRAMEAGPTGRTPTGRIVPATPLSPAPVQAVPGAATARVAGLVAGPPVSSLPMTEAQAEAGRVAFLASCPALMRRTDASGLTRGVDWQPACAAARDVPRGGARRFLAQWFEAAQVGDGRAFATGYYEPEIAASPERRPGFEVPIYARPDDLVDVDLGRFTAALKGKRVRGRVQGTNLVPYYDRTQIEEGALGDRARVLAWAADPVEFFFLQIQGSGRLRMPDGSVMRIGYDTQNGRDYAGIGSLMRQRGLLAPGQASMQGIVQWLHDHPDQGRELMRENKSFVFFREIDGAPQGALGYPVTGGVSAAADPKFVPLGVPVFLSLDREDATGLWVVQDTGGAIKGANRFDTFWGAGEAAEATAGGMSAHGAAFLLLPAGTLERMGVAGAGAVAEP